MTAGTPALLLLATFGACTPIASTHDDTAPDTDSDQGSSGFVWVADEEDTTEEVPGIPVMDVFSDSLIHPLEIELSSDSERALRSNPRRYAEATFIADGQPWQVGMKLKGSSTFDDLRGKPSIKLEFDFVNQGQRFAGLRKLNLHNQRLDPILASEWLLYGIFRAAALPAPRVGYARLTLDGEDYGLYTLVEDPEDDFLGRWFGDSHGNLYENAENYCDLTRVSCFDIEEFDEGNNDALERLIEVVPLSGQAWREGVQASMDWDRMVGFFAMERTISHWDSYSFDQSNYRLYHDPTADSFAFLPWSADLGFGYRPWSYPDCGRHGVDPADYDMGLLAAGCEADAQCIRDVLDRMLVYADLLESMDPGPMVDAALARVRAEAATDPVHYDDMDHFDEHGECVRAFLVQRPTAVRDWVESQR